MVDDFLAGQKLRASSLNNRLPIMGAAISTVSVTSSTTLVVVPGMSVELAANSAYVFDAYFPYTAGATGDLKVSFVGPTGATGTWALFPLGSATTGGVGDVDARRKTAFTSATTQVAGGSDTDSGFLACMPHGAISTGGTGGSLAVWIAQNSSSATSSALQSGAWLRVQLVDDAF